MPSRRFRVETKFLTVDDLRRMYPDVPQAFLPQDGPFPLIFVTDGKTAYVSDVRSHLSLAAALLPSEARNAESLRLASDINFRHEIANVVRPFVRAAGALDANGVIRSFEAPTLHLFSSEPGLPVHDLRTALHALCRRLRTERRTA